MKQKILILIVLVVLCLSFIPSALGKEKAGYSNPFGEKINQKAKKIYLNSKGFWEADYGHGMVMVYIPPGEFKMGSDENIDEAPPHTVYLDGYWIGKTQVTIAQYNKFIVKTEDHYLPEWIVKYIPRNNHPVVWVTWEDASAYCDWLSKETGLCFKLPTEAQWEKAARGTEGGKYPWGNSPPTGKKANFADKQEWLKEKDNWADKEIDDGYGYTAPVGSYPEGASPFGLLDMAGNVWDWCRDWFNSMYYTDSPQDNPMGPKRGRYRAARGGSWNFDARHLRCAARVGIMPSICNYDLGFRLCQEN